MLRKGFLKQADLEPNIGGLEFWLDAFRELHTSRPSGMDVTSIPFTAIVEYFRVWELEDFDEFHYIIRLMDDTFLDLNAGDQKAERDKNAPRK